MAALRIADWLVERQEAGGALPDYGEGEVCNEDSNMEYALVGVAAAYRQSRDPRYLDALERGIRWLAARQDLAPDAWRGSWRYVYACSPPYDPVPTSPGPDVTDVRGVDSTNALFVYLLYVHRELSGSDALAAALAPSARAALEFMLVSNRDGSPFTFSSWQLAGGAWTLWRYRYTADQADVYLGLRAGSALLDGPERRYELAAEAILGGLGETFFDAAAGRWAVGIDEQGGLDDSASFAVVFAQGWVPWALGRTPETSASYRWLLATSQPDGALVVFDGDPGFTLSADVLALAATSLGEPRPDAALRWILSTTYDPASGAVRDTRAPESATFANVAGLTVAALLGQRPFEW